MNPRSFSTIFTVVVLTLALGGCGSWRPSVPQVKLKPFDAGPTPVRQALDLYYQGIDEELAERYEEAEALYHQSLEASARPVVYNRLGVVLQRQQRFEEAKEAYRQALAVSLDYPEAEEGLRQAQAAIDLRELAGDAAVDTPGMRVPVADRQMVGAQVPGVAPEPVLVEEVIVVPGGDDSPPRADVEPQLPPAIAPAAPAGPVLEATLAEVARLLNRGLTDDAAQAVNVLLQAHPDDSNVRFYAGNVASAKGDLILAQVEYERAIALDPSNARAHNNLGIVHEAQGRTRLALQHYEAAVEIGELPDAQYNKAVLLEKRGEYEAALSAFRQYLTLDPTGEWADRARLHIERLQREM